jgi:hypothetical protein
MPSGGGCRSSRIVAYFLILGSFLALCNMGVTPVLSQAVETSTSTQSNTVTYYTVSSATSNLYVTLLTVQYTTSTSLFTIVNIQFTTITSFVTHIEVAQQSFAQAPPLQSPSLARSSLANRHDPSTSQAPQGTEIGMIHLSTLYQLLACGIIILVVIILLRKMKAE